MFKLKVKRNELKSAVSLVSSVVEAKTNIETLQRILMTAEDGQLTLTSTDLDITMKINIPVDILEAGKAAIPANTFMDVIKTCVSDDILMEMQDNFTLKLVCGAFNTTLYGHSGEQFPSTYDTESPVFSNVDAKDLANAITKTIFAVADGNEVYNLKGVFFLKEVEATEETEESPAPSSDQPDLLRLIATDSQRLTLATVSGENFDFITANKGVLVPKKGLLQLKSLCETTDVVTMGLSVNNLIVKTETSMLLIRLLDGNFPNYHGVIPKNNSFKFWVNRKNFVDVIKRISIMCDSYMQIVKFVYSTDILTISCNHPSRGTTSESMGLDYQGQDVVAFFNPINFLEFLQVMKSEKVLLEYELNNPSFLLTGPEDPGFTGVIGKLAIDDQAA